MAKYYVQTSLGKDGYGEDRILYDVVLISELGETTVYETYITEDLAVKRVKNLERITNENCRQDNLF